MPDQPRVRPALRITSAGLGLLCMGAAVISWRSLAGELGPSVWADAAVAVATAEFGLLGIALLNLASVRRPRLREWLPAAAIVAAVVALLALSAFYRLADPWKHSTFAP